MRADLSLVSGAGIQYAGSSLKELQRAFKNPTAHLGLIFSEAGRRAQRAVGLARADVAPLLAPALAPLGAELARAVEQFGAAVEAVLVKYGKGVVEQQLVLDRLAAAAIDLYTAAVVLSRASRAARLQLPAAEHELRLAAAWARLALARVPAALAAATQPHHLKEHAAWQDIGRAVADKGQQLTDDPLNL